jgi:hypothetical protein
VPLPGLTPLLFLETRSGSKDPSSGADDTISGTYRLPAAWPARQAVAPPRHDPPRGFLGNPHVSPGRQVHKTGRQVHKKGRGRTMGGNRLAPARGYKAQATRTLPGGAMALTGR